MPTDPTADVELVRDAWRNAPCPACDRTVACRCVLDDDELRDYRAVNVLSALSAAGRLRPGPLLGVRTADGRILDPRDVVLIYQGLPVPNPTEREGS